MSFLTVSGANVQLTAFKRHEDRAGNYLVRVFNPGDKPTTAKLTFARNIKKAWLTNLNEARRKELKPAVRTVTIPLSKKKIATMELELAAR
jgi:alpha-mannosidase